MQTLSLFRPATALCVMAVAGYSFAAELPDEAPKEWREAADQLRADDFAIREKSTKALSELPFEALPWLEYHLRKSAQGGDPDYRVRVDRAIRSISLRQANADLENGLSLSIDLRETKPEDILKAIDAAAPRGLVNKLVRDIWTDPKPADFTSEGRYWEVVDQFLQAFPPDLAAEAGLEMLHEDRDMTRVDKADLAAINQARCVTGAIHVRAARTAVVRSNGKDFLTFTLIPKLEPQYLPDEVSLLVEGIHFADGAVLQPKEQLRSIKRTSTYRPEITYQPARDFTWTVPLEDKLDTAAPVKIDGQVQVTTRRMRWIERELPVGAKSITLTDTMALEFELEDTEIKMTLSGTENPRPDFGQFSRNGRRYQFELLDGEGKPVKMSLRSGSSSGTAGAWKCSYTFHIGEANLAAVRVLVPGESMKKRLPMIIKNVSLPGGAQE